MCGRFVVFTEEENAEIQKIINEVSEKYKEFHAVNGEAFPTNNVPVIYSHDSKNILSAAKWGFPSFKGGVIINARAESVAEKTMFRKSFTSKRCIVPANGYYEWMTHEDKKKTKFLISVKDRKLFYMAGLYNMFTDNNSGITYPAVTIITTDANTDIAFIHDRMPVIFQDEAIGPWLNKASNTDLSMLQSLLTPYPTGNIVYSAA